MIPRINREKLPIEIYRIRQTVSKAEEYITKTMPKSFRPWGDTSVFKTSAPNEGRYVRSPVDSLLDVLLNIDFKSLNPSFNEESAVVLGSGLGASCFTLSLFFENVVGWEYDPWLRPTSRRVGEVLGDPYNKVDFKLGDFLSDADISNFSLIYFFEPFIENFGEFMGKLLSKASNGAMILCPGLALSQDYPLVFPENLFLQHDIPISRQLYFNIFERK